MIGDGRAGASLLTMFANATLTWMSLIDSVLEKACNPMPMRAIFFRRLLTRFPIRRFATRLRAGAFRDPGMRGLYTLQHWKRNLLAIMRPPFSS